MGNVTTLDYESVAKRVAHARDCVDTIQQSAGRCAAKIAVATEKSSPMRWLEDLEKVAEMTSKSTTQAGDCVEEMLAALKKFDEDTREFVNSSANLDV